MAAPGRVHMAGRSELFEVAASWHRWIVAAELHGIEHMVLRSVRRFAPQQGAAETMPVLRRAGDVTPSVADPAVAERARRAMLGKCGEFSSPTSTATTPRRTGSTFSSGTRTSNSRYQPGTYCQRSTA